jgi:thiol-disulfide isomerase/thioredoxin
MVFAFWRVHQTKRLWSRQSLLLLASGLLMGASAFCLVIGLTWVLSDRETVDTNITIADFTLEDLDGNAVRWSDLGGKPTLLNFWATWCPPCRREMPLLDLANQTYQSQGLNIVGISVGESKETVRRYIDSTGITYPIWVNTETGDSNQTQEIFDKYGGTGLPTTIFANRQGVIRKLYVGELSRGFIDSEVRKLLLQTN